MRLVKVYDAQGNHVDSFKKSQSKNYFNMNTKVRALNQLGYYVRRQFAKSMQLQEYVK